MKLLSISLAIMLIFSAKLARADQTNIVMAHSSNLAVVMQLDPSKPCILAEVSCPEGYKELLYCVQTIGETNMPSKTISIKANKPEVIMMNAETLGMLGKLAKVFDYNDDMYKIAEISRRKK